MIGTDLKPGDTVEFIGYPEFVYGTIKEHCPDHGGYLVRPDGYTEAYGFGYNELKVPDKVRPRTLSSLFVTRYDMLREESV